MGAPRDDLKYQLVIEFPAATVAEFEKLLELEDDIDEELAEVDDTYVDGNDVGTGVFHLFLHTNHVEETFQQVYDFIQAERPGLKCTAGYRLLSDDDYTGLWPAGSTFKLK